MDTSHGSSDPGEPRPGGPLGEPPPAPGRSGSGAGYGQIPGGYTAASPLKTREPLVEWLLCYFVPFYLLFWFHRANKEIQEWSGGRIDYNAASSLMAITFGWLILVPPFVAWASFNGRIREAQYMAGVQPTANFWGSIGRMFLLGYGFKWHQEQLNEIAVRQPEGGSSGAVEFRGASLPFEPNRIAVTLGLGAITGAGVGVVSSAFELSGLAVYGLCLASLVVLGAVGFRGPPPTKMPLEERGRFAGLFSDE